jgi:hypothetical protein
MGEKHLPGVLIYCLEDNTQLNRTSPLCPKTFFLLPTIHTPKLSYKIDPNAGAILVCQIDCCVSF